ncbi:hypothetical protein F5I97DRAFT_1801153 [Phlebopus sp. FC_14]|nr:hypothetical protein F5I97DRAFT_1801153 [Phlebopus sp. FC_14]
MPRFLTGDELGSIKSVSYIPNEPPESRTQLKTLYDGTSTGRTRAIQRLAISRENVDHPLVQRKLASARADGSVSLSSWTDQDKVEPWHEWKETRIQPRQTFVGLAATRDSVFSCTSNGALRLTTISEEKKSPAHKLAALPSRLTTWRPGPKQETFAYGGEEVEVSVWNTERAFVPPSSSPNASPPSTSISTNKKRKRSEALFPGEIWRAKNVQNDYLGLRQPVHNTCLTYASSQQLLVGTHLGDIRRYDTRAGRRPVNEFKGVGKVGGVKSLEKGLSEHEIFVSDQGTNLFALDLRNGGILYGYKGIASRISGAVNAASPAPSFLASVSLDRYIRIHSTFVLPDESGQQLKARGTTLEKVYMITTPTVVIWDEDTSYAAKENEEEEDVWDQMKNVDG